MDRRQFLGTTVGVGTLVRAGCGEVLPPSKPTEMVTPVPPGTSLDSKWTPTTVIEQTTLEPDNTHGFHFPLPEGTKLLLWAAGVTGVKQSSAPEYPNVTSQLVTTPNNDAVVAYSTPNSYEKGDPLATVDATDVGLPIAMWIHNGSEKTITASAAFSYDIVEVMTP